MIDLTVKPRLSCCLRCLAMPSAVTLIVTTSVWLLSYWQLTWDFSAGHRHLSAWQGILVFSYSHKPADSRELLESNVFVFGGFRYFTLRWFPTYVRTAAGWSVHVPIWMAVPPFAIAPIVCIVRVRRAHRRHRRGLCMTCGYDVRYSAARCPECGAQVLRPGCSLRSPFSVRLSVAALGYLALLCTLLITFVALRGNH